VGGRKSLVGAIGGEKQGLALEGAKGVQVRERVALGQLCFLPILETLMKTMVPLPRKNEYKVVSLVPQGIHSNIPHECLKVQIGSPESY
jgi:hypothetical protein